MDNRETGLTIIDERQAERFYDRLRLATLQWAGERGGITLHGLTKGLLIAPDCFILLWRLIKRRDIRKRSRLLLAFALTYFLLPIDIVPDWILGPLGFADDLMLAAAVLRAVLVETPRGIVEAEWSGSSTLISALTGVAHWSDSLVRWPLFRRVQGLISYLLG